ncbi:lanC-like protein 3 [Lineus longissimus]|uniref:lanC-like protein 3 n=1 Tax=Lineus longissimus TaxID=88925 RepID=UPI002B4F29A2
MVRYFKNNLGDFVCGRSAHEVEGDIDRSYWKKIIKSTVDTILKGQPPRKPGSGGDGGLYVGVAGVAYMYYYVAQCEVFSSERYDYLNTARDYIEVALESAVVEKHDEHSFLLGGAGAYAVGSIIFKALGQQDVATKLVNDYARLAKKVVPLNFLRCGSDELFVGRAGYLCGALALTRTHQTQVIDSTSLHEICEAMVTSGRSGADHHRYSTPDLPCPLMYAYYDTEYLGAAHGLSAILQMLLHFPDYYKSNYSIEECLHQAVDFMMAIRGKDGNIAPAMDEVGVMRRHEDETLIHWCHGAPGVVYLFAKAYLVWHEEKYLDACKQCAEVTWRKGLLKKGPGICHGVAGSGYVFLLLYRLTHDPKYLHRAVRFAEFMMTDEFKGGARTPDSPYSLYEGLAGTVCFLTDLLEPHKAAFPFFDVF